MHVLSEPGQTYEILVIAYNEDTRGQNASLTIETGSIPALQPPRHLTLKSVSATSMNATWKPPLSLLSENNNLLYMIRYRRAKVGNPDKWKFALRSFIVKFKLND